MQIYRACAESQLDINTIVKSINITDSIVIPLSIENREQVIRFLAFALTSLSLKYSKLFVDMINLMYKYEFQKTSSVASKIDFTNKEAKNNSTYKHLSRINLLEHTLRVIENTVLYVEKNKYPDHIKDVCILCALFHDFGKNKIIEDKYKMSTDDKHHHISAHFLKSKISSYVNEKDNKEVQEIHNWIYKTIYEHHLPEKDANKSIFRETLKYSDELAREQELDKLGVLV
ncbi:HD domain-containing protein [Patescibacteria group bacterium]|nr:HD domain-containing protein [Patescibacteria group bacterium]